MSEDLLAPTSFELAYLDSFDSLANELRERLKTGLKPLDITNLLVSLLNDLVSQPVFLPLVENHPKTENEAKSCLKNAEKLPLPDYVLWICLSILTGLQKNQCPPTLSRSVLNAYGIIEKRPKLETEQEKALKVYKKVNTEILGEYVHLFELMDKIAEADRMGYALELEKDKKYTDCANVVTLFGLQSKVNIQEILTHLVLVNALTHAKRMVAGSLEYKKLLINLMCSNEYCKKAASLIKEYGFSILDFPHLILRLQKKTVRYYLNALFHQKPAERLTLGQVMELMEDYKSIQILIVNDMIYQEKYQEAWLISTHYKLWEYFPSAVVERIRSKVTAPEELLKKFQEENLDQYGPLTPGAFKMPCAYEDIIFVDDDAGVEKAKELLKADVVGIDAEWRPPLMTFVGAKPAIMQISSEKTFAIFDLNKLDGNLNFAEFIKSLFMSMSILKLGLALKEDMRLVCSKYPKMVCFHHMFNYIDISDFYKEQYPHEKQCSLAAITEKILHSQLCKKKQMSNWNRRPLLKSQMHYAIADAYILILIYNKLLAETTEDERDLQLTSINYTTIPEEGGEEESEIKAIDPAVLFTPEVILKAQAMTDISIK